MRGKDEVVVACGMKVDVRGDVSGMRKQYVARGNESENKGHSSMRREGLSCRSEHHQCTECVIRA